MTSAGSTPLPRDLCMALPSPSTVQPCVTHCLVRSALAQRADRGQERRLEPAAVLIERPRDRRSAGQKPGDRARMEAKCVEPESNQPSSVSVSLSKCFPPQCGQVKPSGSSSSASFSNQTFEPNSREELRDTLRSSRRCRWACRSPCSRTPGSAGPSGAGGRCTSRRARGSWPSCGQCPTTGSQLHIVARRRRPRP